MVLRVVRIGYSLTALLENKTGKAVDGLQDAPAAGLALEDRVCLQSGERLPRAS